MSVRKRTFSMTESVAPYRKPVISSSRRSSSSGQNNISFFNKVKSFFQSDGSQPLQCNTENGNKNLYSVPGGFYNNTDAGQSVLKLSTDKGPGDQVLGALNLYSDNDNNNNDDDAYEDDANASNAKLAQFFREKGDAPLTEMEYEGVMSLIKRSKSVSSTPASKKSVLTRDVNEIKVLRSKSDNHSGTQLRAACFKPKYGDSVSLADASIRRSASSTTRRIFDYSRLPSPYRTTVYKYSAARVPRSQSSVKSRKISENQVKKPSKEVYTPKKLSHTASALISLLDGNDNSHTVETSAYAGLSNPYSSHVSHMQKSKKLTVQKTMESTGKPGAVEPTPAPVKSAALDELSNSKFSAPAPSAPPIVTTGLSGPTAPTQPMFAFKPTKPSSLRVEVTVEKSPEKEAKAPVPQSSTFNFSFSKPAAGSELAASETTPLSRTKPTVPPFNFQPVKPGSLLGHHQHPTTTSSIENNSDPNIFQGNSSDTNNSSQKAKVFYQNSTSKQGSKETIDNKFKVPYQPAVAFSFSSPGNCMVDTKNSIQNNSVSQPTSDRMEFDFGSLPVSGVDPKSVDEEKVEKLKSVFLF
ncbi:FG-nucleoporin NUP60 Ecym_6173 [Eremothecium cymbalariae DBVPG|uniref:Nucleoporin NUP60 n=1 Tax=Eremothecium cymbalariae (strain CBS 270.75 / DBVPG 7215 / KCTC 17166 / NRRL Y-17582) TaxID=931890 RepID=G8JV79_ERECY|nr:hypothetical protein Ecym_6173 [Eremothecium cymbalariae DBVPG\